MTARSEDTVRDLVAELRACADGFEPGLFDEFAALLREAAAELAACREERDDARQALEDVDDAYADSAVAARAMREIAREALARLDAGERE